VRSVRLDCIIIVQTSQKVKALNYPIQAYKRSSTKTWPVNSVGRVFAMPYGTCSSNFCLILN